MKNVILDLPWSRSGTRGIRRALPVKDSGRLLLIGSIAYLICLLLLGLIRHWNYLTSILDLGVFDQSLWGILNGLPFISSVYDFDQPIIRLGVHFNPIIALITPLYLIIPAAEWLILIHALAITITAWPLYALGVRVLASERSALLWTMAYLLNPFVISAAAWDFQSIALATPFMALAMLAVESRSPWLLLVSGFSLLMVREHLSVAVAGFGVLWLIRNRTLVPGLLTLGLAGVGFVLVLLLIMPALSPLDSHLMLSPDLGQLSRYGWLGASPTEVAHSVLLDPIGTLGRVFWEMRGWLYVLMVFLPLAAVPLVGAEFLLPAMADLAANLLSANPMPRSVLAYHSVAMIPVLVVAGMYGARRLSRFRLHSVAGLGRFVLLLTLLTTYWVLPLPIPGALNLWQPLEYRLWPESSVSEIRALLHSGVSLSVQANVGAHFTQREKIRMFPAGLGQVDCVVLRLRSPTARIEGNDPGDVGSLAHHLQMAPVAYLAEVRRVVDSAEYGVRYWSGPWLVLCKGIHMGNDRRPMLHSELDEVARRWSVSPPPVPEVPPIQWTPQN